jgi:hypothetical protein
MHKNKKRTNNVKGLAQHITGLYMLRRQQAARATVLLGHSASLHFHAKPPPHFVGPALATQTLIRPPKRHAEALCEMPCLKNQDAPPSLAGPTSYAIIIFMKKWLIMYLFLLVNYNGFSQKILAEEYQQLIRSFIAAVRNNNKLEIVKFVKYPLTRRYPLPDIKNETEMLEKFDIVFSEEILDKIANSSIENDWSTVGWRGIMFNRGAIWMDYDGTLYGIPLSDKEIEIQGCLIEQERTRLLPEFRNFIQPCGTFKSETYLIRIDKINENDYRAILWETRKQQSDNPDIVLIGTREVKGSMGNVWYKFYDYPYLYLINEPKRFYGIYTGLVEVFYTAIYVEDDSDLINPIFSEIIEWQE